MYRGFAQLSWDLGTLSVGFPLLSEEAHPSFWNKCWELTMMLVLAFWVLVRGIWHKLSVPSSRPFSISSKLFPALWMQFLNFSYCSPVCLEGDAAESFPHPAGWWLVLGPVSGTIHLRVTFQQCRSLSGRVLVPVNEGDVWWLRMVLLPLCY